MKTKNCKEKVYKYGTSRLKSNDSICSINMASISSFDKYTFLQN